MLLVCQCMTSPVGVSVQERVSCIQALRSSLDQGHLQDAARQRQPAVNIDVVAEEKLPCQDQSPADEAHPAKAAAGFAGCLPR